MNQNSLDGPAYGWSKPAGGSAKSKTAQANAQRQGQVDVENKFGAANHSLGPTNSKALDEDTGSYKHKEIPTEFKQALMKLRTAKGLTQADLAQKCNLAPAIIRDYESGKAVPEGAIIQKLNRVLGAPLPKIPKQKKKE
mmetsp:Transcript_23947/g.60418  ORF Transcript_23947/g.60418 Transcript_23947/m.60418 type:complete len:139 (-) Transcript_23947:482-898(-)|eukprot:CAMPEP_0179002734 /NCGR_PEP_ID=MMETSP0795-20121207/12228_1 /TAXON_ID=88552 /ORGANISM="Amoebophrya sp., Strain Ameob2" /LENGTH=138 /DNA_ID=CAMNT_0020696547 /DNA_START=217 /DNA_END=633 /DNA_ORIENTATION=+